MFTTSTSAITLSLLTIIAGSIALNSSALAEETVPTKIVKFSDLNLNNPQDIDTLYQRLQFASRYVCRQFEGRDLSLRHRWQQCYDQALSTAIGHINIEKLSAAHISHTHKFS